MAKRYKILNPTGVDYPDAQNPGHEKHASCGDVVDDFPEVSVKDCLSAGVIEIAPDAPVEKKEG